MKIEVTQDHIDAALFMKDPNNNVELNICERCPVALALKTAGFPDATAGLDGYVYLGLDGGSKKNPILKVRKFIDAFDHGKTVEPFIFEIE